MDELVNSLFSVGAKSDRKSIRTWHQRFGEALLAAVFNDGGKSIGDDGIDHGRDRIIDTGIESFASALDTSASEESEPSQYES